MTTYLNLLVLALISICRDGIAVAQSLSDADMGPVVGMSDYLSQLVPVILAIMLIMRGVSELLLALSKLLKSDKDSPMAKLGNAVAKCSDLLGRLLAAFGIGIPNQIIRDKMAKIEKSDGQA